MDKFGDIKVGDKVLIDNPVAYSNQSFYCLTDVDRVTPRMFFAGGNKYMKSTGKRVGGFRGEYAYKIGDNCGKRENMRDQTKERDIIIENQKITLLIARISRDTIKHIHVRHKNLKEIKNLSEKIADLL